MTSTSLFSTSLIIYVLALIASITVLVSDKKWVERTLLGLFWLGFFFHTVALLVRWVEAGDVEVSAFQSAEGRLLQGWEWLTVWLSHPPWTNLYESLVCFGWGTSLVSLVGIHRFKIRILPLFAISLALIVMGAASLLINQEITPLIPALQSKWIHLHVTMATICYPAFGLAAILSLFYLMKVGVSNATFAASTAGVAILFILSAAGAGLFTDGQYLVSVMTEHGKDMFTLTYAAQDVEGNSLVKAANHKLPIPGAGLAMIVALVGLLTAAILHTVAKRGGNKKLTRLGDLLMGLGFVGLTAMIIAIIAASAFGAPFSLDEAQTKAMIEAQHTGANGATLVANYQLHIGSSVRFSLKAMPFEFILLLTGWLNILLYFAIAFKREWLLAQLPEAEKLDDFSYKTILFAFPFLTLLILTGAIWAYYAWGRYWGWDPKETWSLITWIVYSIYLHVRITHGWEGKGPAVISVLGFGVVIFTYLGVNILLSGLHSYGG